jgi:integrase
LVAEQKTTEVLRRNEPSTAIGKIVEYEFWMIKQGYAKSTIETRIKILRRLIKLGASLYDPESIKETVAKQTWSEGRKEIITETYSNFLVMAGGKWDPPRYKRIEKIPFIPTELEIDQIISGCGEKSAALLQALKETGMRIGEAWNLKWIDIDTVNSTVSITPEKGSDPRQLRISMRLIMMLNSLPQDKSKPFDCSHRHFSRTFRLQRKKVATKL